MKMGSVCAKQVDQVQAILPALQHLIGSFDSLKAKLTIWKCSKFSARTKVYVCCFRWWCIELCWRVLPFTAWILLTVCQR